MFVGALTVEPKGTETDEDDEEEEDEDEDGYAES